MLRSLRITDYRGIRELSLGDTGRINLVVGRNDSGKTTVLEAIALLLTGDPRHLRRMTRNIADRRVVTPEIPYWLAFHNLDQDGAIGVHGSIGDLDLTLQAEIRPMEETRYFPTGALDGEDLEEFDEPENLLERGREIVVKVTNSDSTSVTVSQPMDLRVRTFGGNYRRSANEGEFPQIPPLEFVGTGRGSHRLAARRYSELRRSGHAHLLLEVLVQIEPRLKELTLLTEPSPGSSRAVLEVDLGLRGTLPLESMGDGFASIIAIVTAIAEAKGGLCLVDELENGIHYTQLAGLWRAILLAAEAFDVQIWATTHSLDLLNAAHTEFRERPDALRIHRLDRKEDGLIRASTFDYETFETAFDQGLEVR